MDYEKRETLRGLLLTAVLGVLLVASLALSFSLYLEAGKDRQVVLVPGLERKTLLPEGRVPDETALVFAELYITRFENYTPETIQRSSSRLKTMIAPSRYHEFSALLKRRAHLTQTSGLVSQLVLDRDAPPSISRRDGRLIAQLQAWKRLYVADRLTQRSRVRYRVTIERGEPTDENPFGLFVTGHRADPLDEKVSVVKLLKKEKEVQDGK